MVIIHHVVPSLDLSASLFAEALRFYAAALRPAE